MMETSHTRLNRDIDGLISDSSEDIIYNAIKKTPNLEGDAKNKLIKWFKKENTDDELSDVLGLEDVNTSNSSELQTWLNKFVGNNTPSSEKPHLTETDPNLPGGDGQVPTTSGFGDGTGEGGGTLPGGGNPGGQGRAGGETFP